MVPNRRAVLKGGLAISAAALLARPHWASASPGLASGVSMVVFDDGFDEGRAFAGEARRWHKEVVCAISGDVTSLWYHDLHHRWRSTKTAVAGLTGHSALFCLERLAWDADHRVAIRIDHERMQSGQIDHVVQAPASAMHEAPFAHDVLTSGWPAAAARYLLASRVAAGASRSKFGVRSPPAASCAWPEPLVSWLIVPKSWASLPT